MRISRLMLAVIAIAVHAILLGLPTSAQAAELDGVIWYLQLCDGKSIPNDTEITATFTDGRIAGKSAVNRYFGAYNITGNKIAISELGSTKMAGPGLGLEIIFFEALKTADTYRLVGNRLEILDAAGKVRLVFAKMMNAPTLTGVEWHLSLLQNKTLPTGAAITAVFDAAGISGQAAVNRYSGFYEVEDESIDIGSMLSTKKAGPEHLMSLDDEYFAALKAARKYDLQYGMLKLSDENDMCLLVYEQDPEQLEIIEPGGPLYIKNSKLWVPMRSLLSWLGADVFWDATTRTAVGMHGEDRLELVVGSSEAKIGTDIVTLPSPTFERGGHVYMPLMLLHEAFGVTIDPTPGTHTMTLTATGPPRTLPSTLPMSAEKAEQWQQLLYSFITPNEALGWSAPGAVLLVESPVGRFAKAAGVRDIETRTPVKLTDRFQIGSCTKAFTTTLALQLQEEGVWSLDDFVAKWLPNLRPTPPNFDKITLRQLCQNTSGVWDYANPLLGSVIGDAAALSKAYTPSELVAYACQHGKPEFAPGTSWHYSSTNFILLGMALEAATHQPISELYRTRIFEPAGMRDTFLQEGVAGPDQVVHGYYRNPADKTFVDSTKWNASQGWAAGAIVSTASDMSRFVHSLMRSQLFNSPETLTEMLTFIDIPKKRQLEGFLSRYGLGVASTPLLPTRHVGHTGQTVCFTSLWLYLPDEQTTVVALSNSADRPLLLPTAATIWQFLANESTTLHSVRRGILTTP